MFLDRPLDANKVWLSTLSQLIDYGHRVSPRRMETLEVLHNRIIMNMSMPVVTNQKRKLSYRFMAAEALWILTGEDRVSTIEKYNPAITQFSDDGEKFFGAYGPKIVSQVDYVVNKLVEDRDTRQAVLTIWRENPPVSKDIPCTVAMCFGIRDQWLHCHVFMRSSDAWLGLPYDVFNFSMVAAWIACCYNRRVPEMDSVRLGNLYLTMASSHLYMRNLELARECLEAGYETSPAQLPQDRIIEGDWAFLVTSLLACRDSIDNPSLWRIRP